VNEESKNSRNYHGVHGLEKVDENLDRELDQYLEELHQSIQKDDD
jgi:hypothetical protein